jgi:hypothetical protein
VQTVQFELERMKRMPRVMVEAYLDCLNK